MKDPLHRCLPTPFNHHSYPMAESETPVNEHDFESSLGESLSTKTLQANSMVPDRPSKANLERT